MKKAVASADTQSSLSEPRVPQKNASTDRKPVRGTGTRRRSEYESKEGDPSWNVPAASRRGPWDAQAGIDNLPLGKRQVIDKFFTPVYNHCQEETKAREHYNYVPHHSQHHHHDQDNESHGTPGSSNGSVSQSHLHHQPHGHHTPEHLDHPQDHARRYGSQLHSCCSDASPHSSSHNLDPVASSSRSYSCTSSSSSWSSEASIDKEAFLMECSRPAPMHSQSCSSIPVGGQGFWDEEDGADLEGHERRHPKHQRCQNDCVPKLQRGHSKSDEGLPHTNSSENVRPQHLDHSPLYKSASLGRSLAFNDYTEILLDSEKPKKYPSSIQLPSKGILKNKQGQGGAAGGVSNFRKARSLEVLSTHVAVTAGGLKGGRGGVGQSKLEDVDVEKRKEAVRQNFVQEKLQFSAFLNEITRQVISPSRLSSLGVLDAFRPPSLGQTSQRSPKKVRRAEGERQEGGRVHSPERDRSGNPDSIVSSGHSHSSKWEHSSKRHRRHQHSIDGSSQQHHYTPGGNTNANTNGPGHCPPPGHGQGHRGEKQHQGGCNLLQTDATTTSPELSPYVARRHHSHPHPHPDPLPQHQIHRHVLHSPSPHSPCVPKTIQTNHKDTHSEVLGQESDFSQNKDTASTTSTSLEQSDENKQVCYKAAEMQHKDIVADIDLAQSLQEQNVELRHSLLQTVVRMECMEAELRKTQVELSRVKDSFNRLQENGSSTQQSNKLLEQKLHTTQVLSMDPEQKGPTQRISELSRELATAQATILSLKTINIPSLLQELLDKHFQPKDAVTESLLPVSTQIKDSVLGQAHAQAPGDSKSHALVPEAEEYGKNNWQQGSEGSEGGQRMDFQPWRRSQGHPLRPEGEQKGGEDTMSEMEGGKEAKESLPASLQRPHLQPRMDVLSVCPEESNPSGQQQCSQDLSPDMPGPAVPKSTGTLQNFPSPAGGDQRDSEEDEIIYKWRLRNSKGKVGIGRNILENDANAVTYQAAQRMLDNFMRHLQPPGEREGKASVRGLASGPKEES